MNSRLPALSESDTGPAPAAIWRELLGEQIVVDVVAPYVILGRLVGEHDGHLLLEDADVHDFRDTSTTRDIYVREAHRHGVSVNRRKVWIRLNEVVSVSRMADVVID